MDQKIKKELDRLHKLCMDNKLLIELHGTASCFNCKKIIDKKIKKYKEGNALCPFCGSESVLPGCYSDEVIKMMNKYFKEKE